MSFAIDLYKLISMRPYIITICLLLLNVLFEVGISLGATTGTISGFVRDSESSKPLPNAYIVVGGIGLGASADKSGFYVINNIPAGTYQLRARMIGYATTRITDVVVKTDQNTIVDFALASQVLRYEPEVVITAPRISLPQEAMNTAHHVNEQALTSSLPVTTFEDALSLLPGVVGNHFRGGRSSEVLYLIDGLPVSGATTRELAFMVPNTSIAEMVIQTGGFSAEYGNAQSGLVNVVTKDGRNDFRGIAKFTTNALGWNKLFYDNFQEAEFAFGGPFAASFGGPVIDGSYFLSANAQASDSPEHERLRQIFGGPTKYNYNINAKLMLRLAENIQLQMQTLVSRWNWHEFDPLWDARPSALPERDNRSLRLSAALTHTLTPKMFYTLSASLTSLHHRVRGVVPADADPNIYLPDPSAAAVWKGPTEPWEEDLREHTLDLRFSLVRQLRATHQFSAGVETQVYDIDLAQDRYLTWPLPAAAGGGFVYSRYQDSFHRYPFSIAGFAQSKLKTSYLLANLGVRYDIYNMADGTVPVRFWDGSYLTGPPAQSDLIKKVFSPRLNIVFPLTERSQFSLNYGWFYQMPPLFYAFTNSSQSLRAYWPLLGDLNLKPSRTVAYEASYRQILTPDLLLNATAFWRLADDQVDVLPSGIGSDQLRPGFARYSNLSTAHIHGVEFQIQHTFSEGLSGFVNYTFLRARGTASSAESGFAELLQGQLVPRQIEIPLQWDQNHTAVVNVHYAQKGMNVDLLHRFDGPLRAFESPLVSRPHLPWRYHLDLKVTRSLKTSLGVLEPFVEARNLFDRHYPTVPDEGIPFNRVSSPWQDRFGRSVRFGVALK